jgi:hypothetical protein
VLGGEPVSLPKERRYPRRLASGQDVEGSCPARSLSFSRRKTLAQRGQRCRRGRPPPKPPGATAAFFLGRRPKQLSSAYKKEGSPSLDRRRDAA